MNKVFNFLAGTVCGAIVGATTALLLTPASGDDLRTEVIERWQTAIREGQEARAAKETELRAQFDQLKSRNGAAAT